MTNFRLHFDELKAGGNLPSPSGVALSLLKLIRKPDVSLSEIADVIRTDPSLSGKLIKSANLLKAGTRVIASVSGALNLLGLDATRQLAVSFAVVAGNRRGLCKNFDYMKFWSTSLARAIVAQLLCERERVAQPEECFVGALLSDIGSLALATLYPSAYSEILAVHLPEGENLASERSAFEMDHVELTAALLEDWMLPPLFVEAACHQIAPEAARFAEGSREGDLSRLWHFSHLLAEKFTSGEKAIVRSMPEIVELAAGMNLDTDDLEALSNEAISRWREWSSIFDVPSRSLPSFAEMMAAVPEEEPAPASESEEAFSLRVLVASDDMPGLAQLRHEIASLGHDVAIAANPQDALGRAIEMDSQVVICDFSEDRREFAASLRKMSSGKFVYLIIMIRENSDDGLVKAFAAGADAVMARHCGNGELAARMLAAQRFVKVREELLDHTETLRNTAAELAVANRRAQRASLTDPLTELPNRRYAIERLASEWQRNKVISCLMVDMDRFKPINDQYGHGTGDEAINHVAQILRKASRNQDAVCRFGGEEFLVVLPNTNASAAMNCAERIRSAVESSPFIRENVRLNLTVSIGIASRRPSITHFEDMIKAADAALYSAKQDGRNLVRLSGSP